MARSLFLRLQTDALIREMSSSIVEVCQGKFRRNRSQLFDLAIISEGVSRLGAGRCYVSQLCAPRRDRCWLPRWKGFQRQRPSRTRLVSRVDPGGSKAYKHQFTQIHTSSPHTYRHPPHPHPPDCFLILAGNDDRKSLLVFGQRRVGSDGSHANAFFL